MRRINITALIVFVLALVWVFTWKTPTTQRIQAKVGAFFSPFIRTGASVQEKLEGVQTRSPEELAEESSRLKREVEELRIYFKDYEALKKENEDLRRMLQFSKGYPLKLIPANILTRNSSTWWRTATIDRGLRDGIATDATVVTSEGLVGKIAHAWDRESDILFIMDETCPVAAFLEGRNEEGLLKGTRGMLDRTQEMRLTMLPKGTKIDPGTKVYSSGKGGVFPRNFLLGEVVKCNDLELYAEATVKPVVDFEKLKNVFVIDSDQSDPAGGRTSEVRNPK